MCFGAAFLQVGPQVWGPFPLGDTPSTKATGSHIPGQGALLL